MSHLPSQVDDNHSSDDSDDEYVPVDDGAALSEEDSGNDTDDVDTPPTDAKKGANALKKSAKKVNESDVLGESTAKEEVSKEKSDALWADFMKDCGSSAKKTPPPVAPDDGPSQNKKPKMSEVFEFAGEKVKIEKEVTVIGPRPKGGLASILSGIGKKGKLTTLEKSKLDWESFKEKEGIKEDLKKFNKGKNGYLDRQDFLQRTDVRQFELEKSMRAKKRSS